MSLSEIMNVAKSGLSAAQAGLRANANNIANVGTEGYARERVDQYSDVTAGRGTGVRVGESSRVADRFLEQSVYLRSGDIGRADVTASYLDRMQALLGEPGAPSGLPARLDSITASAIEMTGAQRSPQLAANFIADVDGAVRTMQQIGSDLDILRGNVEAEVGETVDQINSLLKRIHTLNDEVARQQALGRSSAGSEGQRMSAIEELSGLVKITTREQPSGKINIDAANGAALVDGRLRELSYPVNGDAAAQPTYPAIEIRFAGEDGATGPATGERLDTAAVGGKLGGLLELRDGTIPEYEDVLGNLFSGLAETVNAVSNMGTAFPAPNTIEGRPTGLVGSDRLGFTGNASVAVLEADGSLVARADIDFDALGPAATVDDAIAAINTGLGGAGTASLVDGSLVISAANATDGISIGQGEPGSSRSGSGFSHFFGMNDVIRSETSLLTPSGFTAADPHGFGPGETVSLELRDTSGRLLGKTVLDGSGGPTFGDLVNDLNASPMGAFGNFSIGPRGRIFFAGNQGFIGASVSIPADTTDRFGTGVTFSSLSGLNGKNSGLADAGVRDDLTANASRLPLAVLWDTTTVGARAIGSGDTKIANMMVERLGGDIDFGKAGVSQLDRFSALAMGAAGADAAQAKDVLAEASARRDDAVNRRDSFAGVNLDEELSQMVVLQNSYSASARVMTTATKMYDTLLDMVR